MSHIAALIGGPEQVFRRPTLVERIEDSIAWLQVFSEDTVRVTLKARIVVGLACEIELH